MGALQHKSQFNLGLTANDWFPRYFVKLCSRLHSHLAGFSAPIEICCSFVQRRSRLAVASAKFGREILEKWLVNPGWWWSQDPRSDRVACPNWSIAWVQLTIECLTQHSHPETQSIYCSTLWPSSPFSPGVCRNFYHSRWSRVQFCRQYWCASCTTARS